jgi:rare lipoprotein A
VVCIGDVRAGPYAKGRIIDLSPRTASHLGMIEAGVARVEVTPLSIPLSTPNVGAVVALADTRR